MSDDQGNNRRKNSIDEWLDEWLDGADDGQASRADSVESALTSSELEQLLMHSMLAEQFESEEDRQRRVESTLDARDRARSTGPRLDGFDPPVGGLHDESKMAGQPETGQPETGQPETGLPETGLPENGQVGIDRSQLAAGAKPSPTDGTRLRWVSAVMVTVASVAVFAVIGFLLATPQSAHAAMEQVIAALRLPITRVYDVQATATFAGRERELDGTLHTRSTDQFVATFPGTQLYPTTMGSDGTNRWWIRGEEKWSSSDSWQHAADRRDAVIDRLTTLQLQMNVFLTELPQQYELRLLPEEPLPDDTAVMCRPIEATRSANDISLPQTVRIWAHPETGVVVRMHLLREQFSPVAESRVELNLRGVTEVPDTFFTADHHEP